jgi:hypothetical protein
MRKVPAGRAKAHSREPVEPAAAGEPVSLPLRGNAAARKRIDVVALRAVTDGMPMQPESAGDFVRRMRDEDRY